MNIADSVERGSSLFPHKTALIFEEKSFTYQELNRQAGRVANGLRRLGINKGDRVALFLPNIPEFIFSYLGILKLGAIAVSVNIMFKSEEVSYILNDCAAKIIITTASHCQYVANLSQLQQILIAEGESDRGLSLAKVMADVDSQARSIQVDENTPASIVYTSGTTGSSKGATLSHGNVISNIEAHNSCCGISRADKLLLFLPLFHCFGQNAILNAGLYTGATIVLQRRFKIEQLLETISARKVTMFFGVPTVYIKLLNADISQNVLSSIRYYFSAAASMPVEVVRNWQDKYGAIIYEGYGMTETSPCASYNHSVQYKFGSVGMPIENIAIKIVNPHGCPLPPGQLGEIAIKGPNVMLGYWNRPQETAKAIKDGWFYSGDLGFVDDKGYLYIVDRLKDTINMSGFKVYPTEVEQLIYQHPAVEEVAIYGAFDPVKGEIVKANIVLKNIARPIPKTQIKEFCSQRLANYKVPQEINFVEALPKNSTGKILKRVLRQESNYTQAQQVQAVR